MYQPNFPDDTIERPLHVWIHRILLWTFIRVGWRVSDTWLEQQWDTRIHVPFHVQSYPLSISRQHSFMFLDITHFPSNSNALRAMECWRFWGGNNEADFTMLPAFTISCYWNCEIRKLRFAIQASLPITCPSLQPMRSRTPPKERTTGLPSLAYSIISALEDNWKLTPPWSFQLELPGIWI